MPATTDSAVTRTNVDRIVHDVTFSAINAGETFDYTFPSSIPALNPTWVRVMVVTQAVSKDPVFCYWTDDNTPGATNTGRTVQLVLDTVANGSLTGAIARVTMEWLEQASGGISA